MIVYAIAPKSTSLAISVLMCAEDDAITVEVSIMHQPKRRPLRPLLHHMSNDLGIYYYFRRPMILKDL